MLTSLKAGALVITATFCLATAARADVLTRAEFSAAKDVIKSKHKAAKKACDAFANNVKAICIEQADADEKIAYAELEDRNEPSAKHHHKARVARAEAEYDIAKRRCDDKAGTAKDVCVKEAQASKVYALADAETQRKAWKADTNAKHGQK